MHGLTVLISLWISRWGWIRIIPNLKWHANVQETEKENCLFREFNTGMTDMNWDPLNPIGLHDLSKQRFNSSIQYHPSLLKRADLFYLPRQKSFLDETGYNESDFH